MSSLAVIPRDWSYPVSEYRGSSLNDPQSPLSFPQEWLLDIFAGGRTNSGARVSELAALQVSTILTCVSLIAGKISSLPFHVYEHTVAGNGREGHRKAHDHAYYDLVHTEPNEEMSRQTLLKAYLCHCLVWGNGYIEVQRDADNSVVAFWPRNPAKTRPRRLLNAVTLEPCPWRPFPVHLPANALVYGTTDGVEGQDDKSETGAQSNPDRLIPMADMLHVPGLALDGRLGQSTVWLARETIGLALATEKFGAKYFANFAKPGGILEMPMNMNPDLKEQSKRSWMEAQGGENAHRVAVMPPGFKWQAMSNNPQEAQTTETRAYVRSEIASIFHVPVRLVGDTSKGSKASTEQENLELLDLTFQPWLSAIKLEWKRKLFPHRGVGRTPRNKFYVDFDVSGMIRASAADREKFYASGRQWGYLNTNGILAMEGMNPVDEPWAEEYWMPVNATLTTTPIDPTFQDGAGVGDVPEGGTKGKDKPPAPDDEEDTPVPSKKKPRSELRMDMVMRLATMPNGAHREAAD